MFLQLLIEFAILAAIGVSGAAESAGKPAVEVSRLRLGWYLSDAEKALQTLESRWRLSTDAVKREFESLYTTWGLLGEPGGLELVLLLQQQVAAARSCPFPPDSSKKPQTDFALHLLLLRAVCKAATSRLKDLESLHALRAAAGLQQQQQQQQQQEAPGSGFLDSAAASAALSGEKKASFTAADFLLSLGIPVTSGLPESSVNADLAKKFKLLFAAPARRTVNDCAVKSDFAAFFETFKSFPFQNFVAFEAFQVPCTDTWIPTQELANATSQLSLEAANQLLLQREQHAQQLAHHWSTPVVLAAAAQQQQQNRAAAEARRKQRSQQIRRLLAQGRPPNDLLLAAIALL
ncbi:hypothetical protein, conserved [Eimeria necatrix]|uniref:Uncharacterized protein n=1 Tax=Eimeria necatrix TaxID=51315 RepID=U6MES4_9EIME|nr:hypothetical protein, conserved [Eimeria necatrix]CDJ62516.1 hypothetical protein, conserved [Eimeria necatrix]